jgi:hypothetical protein
MNKTELDAILAKHSRWLAGDGGSRANLTRANLAGADLRSADLRSADLRSANLTGAYMTRANLAGADLTRANLAGADLRSADLTRAYLTGADLTRANLTCTCLDPDAPIPSITDEEIIAAGMVVDGDLVRGHRTARSQHCGVSDYSCPGEYTAPVLSVAPTACHPGIYMAGREWLERQYPGIPLVACHCLRAELYHVGDKWRAKRIWVEEVQR